ncbi:uncharacterized protein C18orf63 homolog isoform X2 [Pseudophryne corroboree]|uniref:uncharacterized protein C18orf63 homolog isoform X2 n=1 Tax=Pseudophryne corroboree TaxID=495146 RepID=UPI003081D2AF
MDIQMPESLYFMDLPDLGSLCAVNIIINQEVSNSSIRDLQIKLCRHLLYLYDHIKASPVPDQLNQILVIMPISFYKTGKIQSVAEKYGANMERPERVTSVKLQTCLSYTLVARLAPHWNKAGHLLIQGEDFLAKSGKQAAVALHINVSDTEICISVQVHTIRLPPCEVSDFNITTGPLESFVNRRSSVILSHSICSNWCYILPSMKMGQIINISHDIPLESPFKSYKDFQNHWNMLVNNPNLVNLTTELHFKSVYQDSNHSKNSTEKSQKMVHMTEQPCELSLGNLHSTDNHPPLVYVETIESRCSYPSVSPVGKTERYVPVFQSKVSNFTPKNFTLAAGNTNVVIPQTLKTCNKSDFKIKKNLSVNYINCQVKSTKPLFSQVLEDKGKLTANNLLNKLTNMKNNKETFSKTINTTPVTCSSVIVKTQSASSQEKYMPASITKSAEQFPTKVNGLKKIPACASHKRMAHQNDTESNNNSITRIAACLVPDRNIQEEYLELHPKKCRINQNLKEVDVESHARNNQLFTLRNATLQDWLKQHGISTKTRDKKEQLVTKIMQFIQES